MILEVVRYRIELERKEKLMNYYDVPEIIELGAAHKLILGEKPLASTTDNLLKPFSTDPDELDDFDE